MTISLQGLIAALTAFIGAIAWLVRLEMRIRFLCGEQKRCQDKREKIENEIRDLLQKLEVTMARIDQRVADIARNNRRK